MSTETADSGVIEELPKLSRYSAEQLMVYVRLLDWEFASQLEFVRSPVQNAIIRAVGEREAEVDKGSDASSIAASVGYPRETVRRHISWLLKHRWLEKSDRFYRLGPRILEPDVIAELDESIDRLLRAADRIREIGRMTGHPSGV